jgi:PAS domain S-box-containing protein
MYSVFLILLVATSVFAIGMAVRLHKKSQALEDEFSRFKKRAFQQSAKIESYRNRDRLLFQDAGEAMFIFDQSDGSLLEVNKEAENLTGYTQGEVVHLTFKILFSHEHKQRLLRVISSARKKGHAEAKEIKFRRKDGSHFIGQVKIQNGRMYGKEVLYGSFRDTTQNTTLQLELRRNNRHLTLLNQISHRVTEGHDLGQTLEIILDEVIKSFAISGGGIFLLENRGTEMKLALHRNIPDDVVEELGAIQPGIGLAGKVIETGRPRMSTNLQKDHRRTSNAVAADNWKAFLAVPFIAEEETLGVLFVFDRGQGVFNRDDVRLIQAIGRQLGPILKNAELYDELQWQHRLNFASMRELERSRLALRRNLEKLEQNHRTLQNLNQMKSSFLSLASHELRTPLTTIMSGAEFLSDQGEETFGENEKRALQVIMKGSQRLNHIVDDLLEAAKLEAKALYMAKETFNPSLIIKDLCKETQAQCKERKLQLELHDFPEAAIIRGDTLYLRRAYGRLLENSVKFTPEKGQIKITGDIIDREQVLQRKEKLHKFSESFFAGSLADRYLEIAISDSGIGIDKNDQLLIFDKFHEIGDISSHSTSRARFGGKGVGLGLTLAKGIIETHEGLIWVESAGSNQGSCFSTLLPLSSGAEGQHVLG